MARIQPIRREERQVWATDILCVMGDTIIFVCWEKTIYTKFYGLPPILNLMDNPGFIKAEGWIPRVTNGNGYHHLIARKVLFYGEGRPKDSFLPSQWSAVSNSISYLRI